MMTKQNQKSAQNDAAEAFYGQIQSSFDEQLKSMGATDPRLLKAFKRTRDRYIAQHRAQRSSSN